MQKFSTKFTCCVLYLGTASGFTFHSNLGCVKYINTKEKYYDAHDVCLGYDAYLLNVHPEDGHSHIANFMNSICKFQSFKILKNTLSPVQ